MGDVFVISLTATPPYDSTPAQWERYCNMCGPVDEEISVPELVKEGSLCPHQDYVYFNYPSIEEEQQLDAFRKKSRDVSVLAEWREPHTSKNCSFPSSTFGTITIGLIKCWKTLDICLDF